MGTDKLTKTNPDQVCLKTQLEEGTLPGEKDPNVIFDSHLRFQRKYEKKNFETCFRNVVWEVWSERDDGDDGTSRL